jgi:hypothetical protein
VASPYTGADALVLTMTGSESASGLYGAASCLGGVKLAEEVAALTPRVSLALPQVIVQQCAGYNGPGAGYIRATSGTQLAYTAPGGTEGPAVTVADGATAVLVDGGSASKYVRVTRNGAAAFDGRGYGGRMTLDLVKPATGALAMRNVTSAERAAGLNLYRALALWNASDSTITNLKVWRPSFANEQISYESQLPASGAGTIAIIYGYFVTWPASGFCAIHTSLGALREVVYYTSRTDTSLTVPAAGRALLGTSAAAGTSTDLLYPIHGIRCAVETPGSDGTIQVIANETTAPTGVTWGGGVSASNPCGTIASLAPGAWLGMWLHRQTPTCFVAGINVEHGIDLQYEIDGTTYYKSWRGLYSVADSSLIGHCIYVGVDANPNFAAAPAAIAATLPTTYATTAPGSGVREYRICRVKRNAYGLLSNNRYTRSKFINSSGAEVVSPVDAPQDVTLTVRAGGEVDVAATYYASRDATPADNFRVYAKLGSNPVKGVDTPTEVSFLSSGDFQGYGSVGANTNLLRYTLGPYDWGADLRVLVTTYRSADSAESINTAAVQATVNTVGPVPVPWRTSLIGSAYDKRQPNAYIDRTITIDAGTTTYWRMLPGETQLWTGGALVWRAVIGGDADRSALLIPSVYDLIEDDTSFGAGTGTIEVVAGPPRLIYVNVGGTRRLKIDATNKTVSAAEFNMWDTLTDCPVDDPAVARPTETLLQIYDPIIGRYRAYASVNSSGVFATGYSAIQRKGG